VAGTPPGEDTARIEPAEPRRCPNCGGTRLVYRKIEPADALRLARQDTS
jgi:hypothetical protein